MNKLSNNSSANFTVFFGTEFLPKIRAFVQAARPGNSLTFVGAFVIGIVLAQQRVGLTDLLAVGLSQTLLYAASCFVNDLADQAIDQLNQTDQWSKPKTLTNAELRIGAMVAIAGSLACVFLTQQPIRLVVLILIELFISSLYSLKPFRFSDRGFMATSTLVIAYVSAPLLTGFLWQRPLLTNITIPVLVATHLFQFAFVLFKDWKDVRGDQQGD